jgi:hypothetical protein
MRIVGKLWKRFAAAAAVLVVAAVVVAVPAHGAFPGTDGRVVFRGGNAILESVTADGGDRRPLTIAPGFR